VAEIITDPKEYGSRGNTWDPNFVRYMVEIATHEVYEHMPDAIKEDGKIQWEAPSNRSGGLYQFTHQKRLEWWRKKAISIGINPEEDQWISRTAKSIHPTSSKICKRCGKEMRISYCYPNGNLKKRLNEIEHELGMRTTNIEISTIVRDLYIDYGNDIFSRLSLVFKGAPNLDTVLASTNLEDWIFWLENEVIPSEWRFLSPGAMSNAPDRFDGFHSFNLCCRKKADKGRSDKNLRTYSTDRRVFEYWNGGDWIAADRLMGRFPDDFSMYECRMDECTNNKLTPDHIGPLSLGFAHRPSFGLMCNSHNSGKNNRLTLFDVITLRKHENSGDRITSWQNHSLWSKLNPKVDDEETASRLSKIMRDNQRIAMSILVQIADNGGHSFLSTLLDLPYARYNVDFVNLKADRGITVFDQIVKSRRESKQVEKQMLRRLRISFVALKDYAKKDNRHSWSIENNWKEKVKEIIQILSDDSNEKASTISKDIEEYANGNHVDMKSTLQEIESLTEKPPKSFKLALEMLIQTLDLVAESLAEDWESTRYVR
jgi:Alw26I/Eco31I/Esp3I family type II restriction endonuclease